MGIVDHLFGNGNVFLIGKAASVDHNRSESSVYAFLAGLEIGTVVKMKGYGKAGFLFCGLDHCKQVIVVGIFSCTGRHLENYGGVVLFASRDNSLHYLHIVNVESADSIAAFISLFKHFGCINKWHLKFLQYFSYSSLYNFSDFFTRAKSVFYYILLKAN